jgi:hypothetical protein
LIQRGKCEVHVEKSPVNPDRKRIFEDEEFTNVGAILVEDQSWKDAPSEYVHDSSEFTYMIRALILTW